MIVSVFPAVEAVTRILNALIVDVPVLRLTVTPFPVWAVVDEVNAVSFKLVVHDFFDVL